MTARKAGSIPPFPKAVRNKMIFLNPATNDSLRSSLQTDTRMLQPTDDELKKAESVVTCRLEELRKTIHPDGVRSEI